MVKKVRILVFLVILTAIYPLYAGNSLLSKLLGKARNAVQNSFHLSFLNKWPVIFYRDSFNAMFEHTHRTIDEMSIEYGDRIITKQDFQSDKALHIKKSAELALHLKSLSGSEYFAYGVTLLVGVSKEWVDSSFLNPRGSRCREDLHADIVGAKAVFGQKEFDESLYKYLGNFIIDKEPVITQIEEQAIEDSEYVEETEEITDMSADADEAEYAQELMRQFYDAVRLNGFAAV